MTKIYNDNDLWDCFSQRRKILGVFIGVSAFVLCVIVGFFVAFSMLPYRDPNGTWMKAVTCVVAGLYVIFAFPYMGICFKRSNAYCRMIKFISVGIKEFSVAPFEGIDDWTTRDGVDVNVALFTVRNRKSEEDMSRQVYIDGEKDFPPFEEGSYVRVITQGNLLIEYEITDRKVEKEEGEEICGQS